MFSFYCYDVKRQIDNRKRRDKRPADVDSLIVSDHLLHPGICCNHWYDLPDLIPINALITMIIVIINILLPPELRSSNEEEWQRKRTQRWNRRPGWCPWFGYCYCYWMSLVILLLLLLLMSDKIYTICWSSFEVTWSWVNMVKTFCYFYGKNTLTL